MEPGACTVVLSSACSGRLQLEVRTRSGDLAIKDIGIDFEATAEGWSPVFLILDPSRQEWRTFRSLKQALDFIGEGSGLVLKPYVPGQPHGRAATITSQEVIAAMVKAQEQAAASRDDVHPSGGHAGLGETSTLLEAT